MLLLQFRDAIGGIERVHLERGRVGQKSRTDELVMQLVVAQDVAHILAEKTLDALAEFLHPIDVRLPHAPGAICRVSRAWLERRDGLLHPEIPGDVGDEIAE